jgi:diguanylate cyclase (GGDEF)-like protein
VRAAAVLAALLAAPALARGDARNVRFEHLSLEQGLSQSGVNCILQDRRGFMWFGTQDGLNLYDGYGFTVFKHDPLEPGSLSHNAVWALHESRDGTLWIGTDGGGLNRWDPAKAAFQHFHHDDADPKSLGNDRVRAIQETRDGHLWVGTDGGGLSRLDRATGTFTHFRAKPGSINDLSGDRVRALLEERGGQLWIATDGGGLAAFNPAQGTFTAYRHDPKDPRSLSDDRVRAVFEDRDGVLWVATYTGGLNRLDRATGTFTCFRHDAANARSLSEDRVRALHQDRSGVLWVGTDGGLDEWRSETGDFVRYRHRAADPTSLSDDRVMSIFQDRGGVLWVGTQGGGLNRWNMNTGSFALYRVDPSAPSTLSSNTITALATGPDGLVWVGTYQGLNSLRRPEGTVVNYRYDPADPRSLSDDRVMSVLVDRKGRLWVGTLEGGLNRLDAASGSFTRFRNDPKDETTLSGNGITSLLETRDGALWVGIFRGGLNRFDAETGKITRYRHDAKVATSLGSDSVVALSQDASGALWVGTEDAGLNRFDPWSGAFTRFPSGPPAAGNLGGATVFCIHEDQQGDLWVGTLGAGLHRWRAEDRRAGRIVFTRYTERQGLPNDSVYGILEDDSGDLWLSTNRGLSRFDTRREAFRNFDTAHGLQSNEFNFGAYHRAQNGEMFFGGNGGFNAFLPERVRTNDNVPPVVLTALYRLGRRVNIDAELAGPGGIRLGHDDYVVSFEFAALDFAAPERNRYSYKLEGLDRDWNEAGSVRRASYTNLSPGHYTFRVRGSSSDGVWNEAGVAVPITVLPPPWRTWWAYTLYASAVAGLLGGYARAQARKLEREAEYSRRLEQEVRDRTAELAERNEALQLANTRLEDVSLTDALTGLNNRRFLMSQIRQDVAVVDRYYRRLESGEATNDPAPDFVLMMIDLDGLKGVNDTYGHAAGDHALVQMREVLEGACRKSDTIARWGGDEFLVLARQADAETAEMLAERIRCAVEELEFNLGGGRPAHLGCSLGWAMYPFIPAAPKLMTWEQVATIADRALYAAKSSGRNAWVGILSTENTPRQEDVIHVINRRPEVLLREGSIEARSSLPNPTDIVWERRAPATERPSFAEM